MKNRINVNNIVFIISFFVFITLNNFFNSQLVISNQGSTPTTLLSGFIGNGLTISNPVISCPSNAYGTFSGGSAAGVANGITLTTGNASQIANPASFFMSTNNGTTYSDPQLTSLDASAKYDCCGIEFDVIPSCNQLTIRFVFGSEEYPSYVNSSFNDAFGFFVTGPNPAGGTYTNKNIAIVTGTTICSIDNVNANVNSNFYINNTGGSTLPFGGYTTAITSVIDVSPCQSYHFKMAIADASDHIYDSGVLVDFLQCASVLSATATSTSASCGNADGTASAVAANGIGTLNYTWSPAPGGGQGTANASGLEGGTTYTVTVDDVYSCIAPVTSSVTIASSAGAPNITNSPLSQTICSGSNTSIVNLTADVSGTTFVWTATASAGISGFTTSGTNTIPVQIITNSGTTAGTVTYAITPTAVGCVGPVTNYVVTVNPTPIMVINSTGICNGSSAILTATPSIGGGTYLWDTGATANSITVTPGVTTTYSCVYTLSGCSSTEESGTVTVNPLPVITVNSAVICSGFTATLTATGGVSYVWGGDPDLTSNPYVVSPILTTNYFVVGTDINGCSNSAVANISVSSVPSVAINSVTVCNSASATLTATPSEAGGTYLWASGETTPSITVTPSSTTTYSCVYTLNGCSSPAGSGIVTVNPIPTVTINSPSVCVGGTITLTATPSTGGGTYLWGDGETTNTISVTPGSTTTYSCVYTLNGCVSTAGTGTVTVLTSAPINAGTDQIVCENTSVTLTATGGATYTWDNGITNGTAFTPIVGTITYTVTGTDANGCVNTDQADVTVNPLPVVSAGADQTVCVGTTVTLSGSGAVTYVWDNGITDGVGFTPALGTVTYTVIGTDANGCVNTDQVKVAANALPIVNAGPDQVFCEGTSVTFIATGAVTYVWDNDVVNGVSFTPAAGTITYIVTGTDINGCMDMDQMSILVNALPIIDAGIDQEVCDGTMITLSGSGAVTYSWDNDVMDNFPFFQTENVVTYEVTGMDTNGCVDSDQVVITVNSLPEVIAGSDQVVCEGTIVTLSASGASTYIWDNDVINNVSFIPAIGVYNYSVTGTDIHGCIDSDQIIINVKAKVVPEFESISPICQNIDGLILPTESINNSNITLNPVTGSWNDIISTDSAGIFLYTFTPNSTECATVSTIDIIVNPLPVLIITNPSPVCQPLTVDLTDQANILGSSGGIVSYWNDSLATISITNPQSVLAGIYYVKSESDMQCAVINPITAIIHTKPDASFDVSDENLSSFNSRVKMINLSTGAESYEWIFQNGDISFDENPEYIFPDTIYGDQYIVLIAKSAEGCTDTTIQVVNIKEELIYYIPNTFTPDGDKFNQIFQPIFTSGYDPYNYSMVIYNRWGEVIFESHDTTIGWDGTYGTEGRQVKEGIYTWKIEFEVKEDDKKRLITGNVNLIR